MARTGSTSSRVPTGLPQLDEMLGGGLVPGTLAVVYGATGIGKTHLGLTFAAHGSLTDGARGLVFDMNGRGDPQQHDEYPARLFGWTLTPWRSACRCGDIARSSIRASTTTGRSRRCSSSLRRRRGSRT